MLTQTASGLPKEPFGTKARNIPTIELFFVVMDDDGLIYSGATEYIYIHLCTVQIGARLVYMVRAGTTEIKYFHFVT